MLMRRILSHELTFEIVRRPRWREFWLWKCKLSCGCVVKRRARWHCFGGAPMVSGAPKQKAQCEQQLGACRYAPKSTQPEGAEACA